MARKRATVRETEDVPETDRLEGFPHPRETTNFVGDAEVRERVSRAIRSGRPPQAWLIAGSPGIGKATLAYRIARYLLVYGATDAGPQDLSVPERDPQARLVSAGSHPGLLALRRSINLETGRLMTVISVDQIRRLGNFFSLTSAMGGWRIVIIDTTDDLNENAANAMLKWLEEPPKRAILMLLSNMPGRVLPTIRSRCQRIDLKPLGSDVLAHELERLLPETKPAERKALAQISQGSLGGALALSSGDGVMLAKEAERVIERSASPDVAALISLGDKVARVTDGVEIFGQFLVQNLSERIRARARRDQRDLEPWLDCAVKLRESFERSTGLYLDPRQTVFGAAHAVAATTRRAGTV